MIGVIAIAGPSLVDGSLRSAGSQLVVAALAFGLQTLSAFLYLAVHRINDVLTFYQQKIFEYIESFHNTRRRHSSLNMLTPTEFEEFHQKESS